jgi:hypothetical protein
MIGGEVSVIWADAAVGISGSRASNAGFIAFGTIEIWASSLGEVSSSAGAGVSFALCDEDCMGFAGDAID